MHFSVSLKRRPSVETAGCGREIGKPNGIVKPARRPGINADYSIALNDQPIRFADEPSTCYGASVSIMRV